MRLSPHSRESWNREAGLGVRCRACACVRHPTTPPSIKQTRGLAPWQPSAPRFWRSLSFPWPSGLWPKTPIGQPVTVPGRGERHAGDEHRPSCEGLRVSAKMIRHYEQVGLFPEPGRTDAGYRQYNEKEVHALRFIRQARDLGFSIPQIGELVGLWQNRRRPSRQVKALGEAHIQELQQKAQDLHRDEGDARTPGAMLPRGRSPEVSDSGKPRRMQRRCIYLCEAGGPPQVERTAQSLNCHRSVADESVVADQGPSDVPPLIQVELALLRVRTIIASDDHLIDNGAGSQGKVVEPAERSFTGLSR